MSLMIYSFPLARTRRIAASSLGSLSLFLFLFISSFSLQGQCDASCGAAEACLESVCACDDGAGNITLTIQVNNFPTGCGTGYDVGIIYTNDVGGNSIASVMGVTSSTITFPAVTNMGDPADIAILSISNTCTNNGEPFCSASVSVTPSTDPVITTPADMTVNDCMTQVDVDAAFNTWLSTASVSNGCNPMLTDDNSGAPDACGGATTVTWTATSTCGTPVMASATFTVTDASAVVLTPPADMTVGECMTQVDVDAAFSTWLGGVSSSGGCSVMISDNSAGAPDACGGDVTVVFTASSDCEADVTGSATFTVTDASAVVLTPPADMTVGECMTQVDVDAAFSTWLGGVSSSGGCSVMISDNSAGAPDACGGDVTVVFTASSDCEADVTGSATFTVTDASAVVLTPPADMTVGECMTQVDVDAAFSTWLGGVSSSGGCSVMISDNSAGAPDACGGDVTVVFTASSDCEADVTGSATFTVTDASAVVLTPPADMTVGECMTQADIDMAFASWISGASSSGGCNVMISDDGSSAPDSCGGDVTVVFTASSDCEADVTGSATFTVTDASAVVLTPPADMTVGECMTQADIDMAFASWISGASSSGGCNVMISDDGSSAPDSCGGDVTVVFTASSDCEADVTGSATFTVTDASAVVLTPPADMTVGECMTQADIDMAFASWISGASSSGGCNVMISDDGSSAPDSCGGDVTVVFTASSDCEADVTGSATFTVTDASAVVLTPPADMTVGECMTQADIDMAFNEWYSQVSLVGSFIGTGYSGPSGPSTLYSIDGNTGDATAIGAVGFDRCGSISQDPISGDYYSVCQRSGSGLPVLVQIDPTTGMGTEIGVSGTHSFGNAYSDGAFRSDGTYFVYLEGGDGLGTVNLTTGALTELGSSGVSCCGNGIAFGPGDVLYHANENALHILDQSTGNASFLVTLNYPSGGQIMSMYYDDASSTMYGMLNEGGGGSNRFLCTIDLTTGEVTKIGSDIGPVARIAAGSSSTISGGCNPVLTDDNTGAPDACGGNTTVTWTVASDCEADVTASATFTVTDAPAVVVTPPTDAMIMECQTQMDVDMAFSNWLATASIGGGCNAMLSNNAMAAPDACGGSVTVEFTGSSDCEADVVESATFTVTDAPAMNLTTPSDVMEEACQDQDDIDLAFDDFLNDYTLSGGCPSASVSMSVSGLDIGGYDETIMPSAPVNAPMSPTVAGTVSSCDDCTEMIALPFTFSFYGVDYNSLWISSNGYVTFTPPMTSGCCSGTPLPTDIVSNSYLPTNFIALWWTDILPFVGGNIQYGTNSDGDFVISFVNLPPFGGGSDILTGHIVLSPNGNIEIIYESYADYMYGPATIGIQNADGSSYQELFHGDPANPPAVQNIVYEPIIAPSACGGSAMVTWTANDGCSTETGSATFTVEDAEPITFSCSDLTIGADMSQVDADAALAGWVDDVINNTTGGCNLIINDDAPGAAPDVCIGGTVTVEFTIMDDCFDNDTCTATFTVPPSSLSVNPMGAGSVCIDLPVELFGKVMGGSGNFTHRWTVITGMGTFDDAFIENAVFTPTSSGNVELLYEVTDTDSGCTVSQTMSIYVQDDCDYEFTIDDPCVCNNDADVNADNGTFMELMTVTGPNGSALPNGMSWTFTDLTGAYSASPFNEENIPGPQGSLLAAGQTMQYCSNLGGCTVYNSASGNMLTAPYGSYYLVFSHVDAEGYCGSVQGPFPDDDADPTTANPANTVLSLCNTCFYPNVSVLNLPPTICESEAPITIQGVPTATGNGTWNGEATFTGGNPPYSYGVVNGLTDNGDGTATFDPSIAGAGTYTLSYTFEDQPALGGSEPGCFQAVQASITVTPNVDPSFTDDDDDNIVCLGQIVTLTANAAGGIFTGDGVTDNGDGTATFTTNAEGKFVVTYSYTNGCAGSYSEIYETDNIDPTITCPADVAVSNDAGICGAVVDYDMPMADDNCGVTLNAGAETFVYTGVSQFWTVPAGVTSVNIVASGGSGGNGNGGIGGRGATMSGDFAVSPGDVLEIVVGQGGQQYGNSGGGGAGSGVLLGGTPLVIAGGGGGGAINAAGYDADIAPNGGNSSGLGGISGAGGQKGYRTGDCGWASGGGGFMTDGYGGDGTWDGGILPGTIGGTGAGLSWANGGAGGMNGGCTFTYPNQGSWGLGGGAAGSYGGGGGGGYSGGGGGQYVDPDPANRGGGGGGSLNNGMNQVNIPGNNTGNGVVVITTSGSDLVLVEGLPSGSIFPVGTTTNTYVITDNTGNTASCSFEVEVADDENPMIACPADVTISTSNLGSTGDCAGQYDWNHALPTDNCYVSDYTVTYTNPTGTVDGPNLVFEGSTSSNLGIGNRDFELGTTTINYYVEDASGNTATCGFTVTVEDDETPVFADCPNGLVVDVFTNDCTTNIFWSIPNATDNCGVTVTQTAGPAYGSAVAPGMYTITYEAADNATPANSVECTFDINVIDTENPVIVNCPFNDQILDVNGNCEGILPDYTVQMGVLDNCTDPIVDIVQLPAPGTVYAVGDVVMVSITVTDASNNSSVCSFDVLVEDNDAPVANCLDLNGSVGNGDNVYLDNAGMATISVSDINDNSTDNCGIASIVLDHTAFTCNHIGANTVTMTVTDVNGNQSSCLSEVVVVDSIMPMAMCNDVTLNLNEFGNATVSIDDIDNGSSDNCAIVSRQLSESFFDCEDLGSNTINLTIIDQNGNSASCDASITITDTETPVFANCPPAAVTYDVFTNDCEMSLVWSIPTAIDNCKPIVTQTSGPAYGSLVGPGVYNIEYTAMDLAGNSTTCAFVINVVDTENPLITCPTQSVVTVVPTDAGVCEYTVLDGSLDAIVSENCDSIAVAHDFTSAGSMDATTLMNHVFPIGQTNVTWTATDSTGNSVSCSFILSVLDEELPTITCIADITVGTDDDICGAIVDYDLPMIGDNCPLPADALQLMVGLQTGAEFPIGTTTIIYRVTDAAGNTAECGFDVTVEDDDAPMIDCTIDPNDPQMTEMVMCESEFAWNHPVPTDNCSIDAYTYKITNPDGTVNGPFTLIEIVNGGSTETEYAFEEGTTVVEYYVVDEYGNESSCSFSVIVTDEAPPHFANCPADMVFGNDPDQCGASVNWVIPHAYDNCDTPITVEADPANEYAPGDYIPVGSYTIRYTASDNDGNEMECVFMITVEDTQEPEILVGKPQDETVDCDNVPTPLVLGENDVEDNCTDDPTIEFDQVSTQDPDQGSCDHYNYTVTNVWTVTDEYDNAQVWEQVVTVQDTVAPILTLPLDATVECDGQTMEESFVCDPANGIFAPNASDVAYGIPNASDNCASDDFICIEYQDVFTSGNCGFTGTIERTWTATDPCGNAASAVQVITIVDETAPEFTCMDVTIELDEDGLANIGADDVIDGGINAVVDACSDPMDLTYQMSQTDFDCSHVGSNEITLIVTDDCGNSAACLVDVTVVDVTVPNITCPSNAIIQLDAGECEIIVSTAAQATDNCDVVITYSPDLTDFLPIGLNTITATATDPSGNNAQCSFTIEVVEHVPSSNSLNCNNNINVSLDGDCQAVLNADMLLEGGDYRCYDNYCIEILDANGIPHGNSFDLSDVGQTFEVTITDCMGSNNSCWGYVNIEEKLLPEIECPADVTISCSQDPEERDQSGRLITGEAELLTCEPSAVIEYEDNFIDNGQCESPRAIVERLWRIIDQSGNEVTCTQIITIDAFDLNDVVFPANLEDTDALTCKDVSADASLVDPANTGYPVLNDVEINLTSNLCMASLNYSDEIFNICDGSYEILRTWKIRNMCQPVSPTNPRIGIQVIKVLDVEGPKLQPCPQDTVISTGPWSCYGEFDLPIPDFIYDECTNAADFDVKIYGGGKLIRTGYYSTGDLNIRAVDLKNGKTYTIRYTASDPCGNTTVCTFDVSVRDLTAPVAIAKEDIVLSLGGGAYGDGTAKLFVESIDNDSYDNCTDVYIEIRRHQAPECTNLGVNGHNNNNTYDDDNHADDNINDTDDGQFVKFCCEDLSAVEVDGNQDGVVDSLDLGYVQVFMRVWDDANGSGVYGDEVNGYHDNYNESWTFVKVEDKLPPIIACPADATIYCDWGIDVSADFGNGFQNADQANFDKTGVAEAYGSCGVLDVFFNDNINLDDCGVGTIIRQFQATNSSKTGPKTVTCQQVITVEPRPSQFQVLPPNQNPLSVGCTLTQSDLDKRLPTVIGGPCDVIGENVSVDTFLFENGVCKKWVAEYNYMNWCTGESMGPFYAYFVYEDTEKPVLDDCDDKMFEVDANCEHVLTLTNSATDGGGCTDEGWLKWQLFVDTWADGNINHYASSFVSPTAFRNWKPIAGNDPLLPGGHTYADVVYVKYIEPTSSMGNDEASITLEAEVISGMMSNHKVHWKVTDGCHNHSTCSYDVMVVDKKAPTPYCVSLSSAVMENGGVELWASDFDKGSFDNCTPQQSILFTFNEVQGVFADTIIKVGNKEYLVNSTVPHYFDENGFVDFDGDGVVYPAAKNATINKYNEGDIQKWAPFYRSSAKVFDCDEYLAQGANGYELKMSVWDLKLNTDFCIIYLSLVDNHGACDPNSRMTISGKVLDEKGEGVSEVTMTIEGSVNDFVKVKTVDGSYEFTNLPQYADFTINAEKDIDYMNGISTLDLILIQRHILQLQEFTSPYQMISADVTADGNIRASDLVELRKLILGLTSDFTATSWKFHDSKIALDIESAMDVNGGVFITDLSADVTDADFVGTKIGDVSGDALANARSQDVTPRSNKKVQLMIEDVEVKSGDKISVAVTANNFKQVFGYQFTMGLRGLEYSAVKSGAIDVNASNIGLISNTTITSSWAAEQLTTVDNDAVLFTLEFVATQGGQLSTMLTINSDVTKAESYTGSEMSVSKVELGFRTDEIIAVNALHQNEPNPFKESTMIMYEVAEAGISTFTLYDVTGKVLLTKDVESAKGMNTISFGSDEINTSGIVYYQIESGDYTATKKMMIIE